MIPLSSPMPPSIIEPTREFRKEKKRGRIKGRPNKSTDIIKFGWIEAYERLGGVEGLVTWGKKKPDLFYPTLIRLLPKAIPEEVGDLNVSIIINRLTQELPSNKPLEITAVPAAGSETS